MLQPQPITAATPPKSHTPVGGALGSVDQLVGQALRDGLDVAEGSLTRASGQQPDGLKSAGYTLKGMLSDANYRRTGHRQSRRNAAAGPLAAARVKVQLATGKGLGVHGAAECHPPS